MPDFLAALHAQTYGRWYDSASRQTEWKVVRPMANIKQQKKRIRTASRQRMENLRYRSTIKTMTVTLQRQVNASDKDGAAATHRELVRLLDRAIARNVLHANTAARKKARAARILISEPQLSAAEQRRAAKSVSKRGAAAKGKGKATKKVDGEATAEKGATAKATKAPATKAAPKKKAPAKTTAAKAKAEAAEAKAEAADATAEAGDAAADAE